MIPVAVRDLDAAPAPVRARRRRFGLDTPLPADPRIVERAILRHLADERPAIVVLGLAAGPREAVSQPAADLRLANGVPDLLLLLPDGRAAFLAIKPQAHDLTRAQRAFADLCRACAVPHHVVRSLAEARAALDRLTQTRPELQNETQDRVARRLAASSRRP